MLKKARIDVIPGLPASLNSCLSLPGNDKEAIYFQIMFFLQMIWQKGES